MKCKMVAKKISISRNALDYPFQTLSCNNQKLACDISNHLDRERFSLHIQYGCHLYNAFLTILFRTITFVTSQCSGVMTHV